MAEQSGKLGAIYAAYGDGIQISNESRTLSGGAIDLVNTNVIVSKITSDAGGSTPITKTWTCTVKGHVLVADGGTDGIYVTYKYWNEGVYAHKNAASWQASTAYSVGDRVLPTTPNDHYYEIDTGDAGSSGASEPDPWGTVVTETTADGTATWTCHSYSEVGIVGGFFNWTLDKVGDLLETTDFESSGHKTYLASMDGWTASADRHWLTVPLLEGRLSAELIIKFYTDRVGGTKYRWEGIALVTGFHLSTGIDTLVNEPLDFQGKGLISYQTT